MHLVCAMVEYTTNTCPKVVTTQRQLTRSLGCARLAAWLCVQCASGAIQWLTASRWRWCRRTRCGGGGDSNAHLDLPDRSGSYRSDVRVRRR